MNNNNYHFSGRTWLVLFLLAVCVGLSTGCAATASKYTVATCQLADGYTTKRALDRGAMEANPFLSDFHGSQIMGLKIIFAALALWLMPDTKDMNKGEKFLYTSLNVVTCGVAMHNNQVQR